MKKLVNEIVFGKNATVSGVIALMIVLSFVLGCNCGKNLGIGNTSNTSSPANSKTPDSTGEVPSNAVVESLVKGTMAEFAAAVQSEDFSSLYNNSSTNFQHTYTLDEVKTAFKSYTDKKKLVVPILKKIPTTKANFTKEPTIENEKGSDILVASGKFPTKPVGVRFDYKYIKISGEWKLLNLVINIP